VRRVVVTGMGIVSCIGNDLDTVSAALAESRPGIRTAPGYAELGLRSQVAGIPQIALDQHLDRRDLRFMGDAAAFAAISLKAAIADAGLSEAQVSDPRTGLIAGTGGGSPANVVESADLLRNRGVRKIGPTRVPRTMCSTVAACLATSFRIRGVSFSVTSACATSAHCIGVGAEQIQWGKQDVMLCGGGEEEHWSLSALFDAMGALSSARNESPSAASRAYDAGRDGFVIASGGGMLVLESLDHALARNARIYAELVGYGVTADGHDMVQPSGEGAARCMRQALTGVSDPVQYLNTHGTSTPVGDVIELKAVRDVFGEAMPPISSTKSLSGHSLGAAGVQEAIYSLLMMRDGFVAGSANIDELDAACAGYPILRESERRRVDLVMSNSFGFGGTNASLVFRRY
jgi:3-oxoacyl-[acyl-carrier-protein] synthase I